MIYIVLQKELNANYPKKHFVYGKWSKLMNRVKNLKKKKEQTRVTTLHLRGTMDNNEDNSVTRKRILDSQYVYRAAFLILRRSTDRNQFCGKWALFI